MEDYLKPLLKKLPCPIILHIGTNNTPKEPSKKELDRILSVKQFNCLTVYLIARLLSLTLF